MEAVRNDDFASYWTETSAAASLMGYISLDFDGLSKTITELLGGGEVKVDTIGFAKTIRQVKHDETIRRVQESDRLILDTVNRESQNH